ncbi:MAG: hypothetical protein DMG57_15220 [Acidobacteria bacterium]|nr:MAG: hypothetical protein DMG57_15220 [Acidobacteriota bacterium]
MSQRAAFKTLTLASFLAVSYGAFCQEQSTRQSRAEMEEFLRSATIVQRKALGTGVTSSDRAKLSDGHLEHDAHVQSVNIEKPTFTTSRGTELNFKDSYKFNIAAYKLDQILGLNMVPVSIERKVAGKTSAVTWWVDDVLMDELQRHNKNITPPDLDEWSKQMHILRVFDQLIYNTDRNLGNLLIDKRWQIWMIDHTRAFRSQRTLLNQKNLAMCDRTLLASLRKLDEETLMAELKAFLTKTEVKALIARRDLIVKFFDDEVASKGEGTVLYDLPRRQ